MANVRESFPTLEDTSGEGVVLSQVESGDSPINKNGSIGFAFRDSSGNVVMPQLTAEGKLPVDTEAAAGTEKKAAALAGGSSTEVEVASITLTVNKVYTDINARVSCFRDAVFRLVQLDNVTETELDYALSGSGQYTNEMGFGLLKITAGSTGTQKIRVMAKNENALSDFRAAITCLEIA